MDSNFIKISKILFFSVTLCVFVSSETTCVKDKSLSEYTCPPTYYEDGGFVMRLNDESITISCNRPRSLTAKEFPNVTFPDIYIVKFRFCPLPDAGFKDIFDKLAGKNMTELNYEYGMQRVNKKHFEGLGQVVRFLHLGRNKFRKLDEDVFENIPNLVALDLQDNGLTTLGIKTFQKLKFLEYLELNENEIENIPVGLFRPLESLKVLVMYGNNLKFLNESDFEGLRNLEELDLRANQIGTISENAFKDLKNLIGINLSYNRLTSAKNIFDQNTNLQRVSLISNRNFAFDQFLFSNLIHLNEVDLSNCDIMISDRFFENSTELEGLSLRGNHLSTDLEKILRNLTKIKRLDLSEMYLQKIDEKTFFNQFNLEELNLANNKITYIHQNAFFQNKNLKIINLSANFYDGEDGILWNLHNLEDVDLSDNLIVYIEGILTLDNKPFLKNVDLRKNRITTISIPFLQSISKVEIHLEYNDISTVEFDGVDIIDGDKTATIFLEQNPIRCDCHNFDLFKYLDGKMPEKVTEMFNIVEDDVYCATPVEMEGRSLKDVELTSVGCPLDEFNEDLRCPEQCMCLWRSFDESVGIDCSNKNLSKLPDLDRNLINFTVELNLTNNNLVTVDLTGYDNIVKLFLSHNQLKEIFGIPRNLKVLTLEHNNLQTLTPRVLENLNTTDLTDLTLLNNPWFCSCSPDSFEKFLRSHNKLVDDIYCSNSTIRVVDFSSSDDCNDYTIVIVISSLSAFLVLVAISLALYYKYQQTIKIWLFTKNCLWVSEDDLDDDRIYDAFISYSHKDEYLVVSTLIPELEAQNPPYKLCIADRDWTPGEPIVENITKSILNSKRTVVVLSKNFLKSVWGKAEFQQAYSEAMEEKRPRVVIIIYGDVDVEKIRDTALKTYLKTNTYVRWGDPYFWAKLKFALPHHRRPSKV